MYENTKTKIKIKCNTCGFEDVFTFDKYIYAKRKCKKCVGKYKRSKEEFTELINNICKERDYTFLGYSNPNENIQSKSKIILQCNKCKMIWDSTTIINLMKNDRKSHSCKRKNPLSHKQKSKFNKNDINDRIKNCLKNTSLNIIEIIEKENGYPYKVLVKCKKCGKEHSLTLNTILYNNKIKCKHCENYGKISNEVAITLIMEKCEKLNCSFLGFMNEEKRYNGKWTKVKIKCNMCNSEWITTFNGWVKTYKKCMTCSNKWLMENEIRELLIKNNISFETEKKFSWMGQKRLDFYLPDFKIGIECQGKQHFVANELFGGEKDFLATRERDIQKLNECKKNDIKLLYYSNKKNSENIETFLNEKIIKDKEKLLEIIYGNK